MRSIRKAVAVSLVYVAIVSQLSFASDTHTLDKETSVALLQEAAKGGTPLTVTAPGTVQGSVSITAVLLTKHSVQRLFGKEIADTYAVVQVSISNKGADASFVLHNAYLDLTNWALGGRVPETDAADPDTSRTRTKPNQIPSVEARIARGELMDAQQWTARNWTMRLLTLAGSLATGFSFSFKEAGIAKGLQAFSGSFVPGVGIAWPDGTVAQLNRVSDFGYRTNKVFGKETADPIVCFFPMDMFLVPSLKKVFLNTPALFLSPGQLAYTPEGKKVLTSLKADGLIIAGDAKGTLQNMEAYGLQQIGIYVDGTMTLDVNLIPASIDKVTFTEDDTKAAFWSGTKQGVVECRFCDSGVVSIDATPGITVTDIPKGSDGTKRNFSITIAAGTQPPSQLTFYITKTVTGPTKATQVVKGAPFTHTVTVK